MNEPRTDIEKMLRPDLWPNRPILPMKTYMNVLPGQSPRIGIYHEDGRFWENVNVWQAQQLGREGLPTPRQVRPAQLIEEGWVID